MRLCECDDWLRVFYEQVVEIIFDTVIPFLIVFFSVCPLCKEIPPCWVRECATYIQVDCHHVSHVMLLAFRKTVTTCGLPRANHCVFNVYGLPTTFLCLKGGADDLVSLVDTFSLYTEASALLCASSSTSGMSPCRCQPAVEACVAWRLKLVSKVNLASPFRTPHSPTPRWRRFESMELVRRVTCIVNRVWAQADAYLQLCLFDEARACRLFG